MLPCAQSFDVDRSGETKAIEAARDSPGSRLLGISGRKEGFRSFQDYRLDLSARAVYIVPPNSEGRVPSFSTRSTPASLKSWRSLSKSTGYGHHLFGLGR